MSQIALSAGVRANLLSLQNTAQLMQQTQTRLATGKKVNSALDNPLNFFTSQNLNNRANSLNGLLDAMSNGIQTIQAANNGLTSITSLVEQLQSVVSQARADTTQVSVTPGTAVNVGNDNTSSSGGQITFQLAGGSSVGVSTFSTTQSGWAITGTPAGNFNGSNLATGTINIQSDNINGGAAISVSLTAGETAAQTATSINAAIVAADPTNGGHVWAQVSGGNIKIINDQGNSVTVSDGTGTGDTAAILGAATGAATTGTVLGATSLAAEINSNGALSGVVKASVDATTGGLSLQNLTTSAITLKGGTGGAITGLLADSLGTLTAGTGGGISSVRQSLLNQYNTLRTQIDQMANDAGYNGTNLLNGDSLSLNFNENGSSSITIQMQDSSGNEFAITSADLGIASQTQTVFGTNTSLDALTTTINSALSTLQTQATAISSSLSVVQTRQDFTKQMVNTLQTGASNLVLADPNQEGANLLALQTRQSLSTTALSLSSQADQAVLRLFQ